MVVATTAFADAAVGYSTRVERYPVTVEGEGGHEILNVIEVVECFDHARSVYTVWPEDDEFGHRAGALRMVAVLCVDARAAGHDLFRVAEWPFALLASERLKLALESARMTGLQFIPLDGSEWTVGMTRH
jgi:hypothetical protein